MSAAMKGRYWAMEDLATESEGRSLTGKSSLLAPAEPPRPSLSKWAQAKTVPTADSDDEFFLESVAAPDKLSWWRRGGMSWRVVIAVIAALALILAITIPLAVLLPVQQEADLCSFPAVVIDTTNSAEFAIGSTAAVGSCLASIPLEQDVKDNTLGVLQTLNLLYQFTDLAVNASAPYNIAVDLVAENRAMAATEYSSDYSFHRAVQRVYNRLFDAHTFYALPLPYQQLTTLRPFTFACALVNASQIVYAIQETTILESFTYTDLRKLAGVDGPADLTSYIGVPVSLINGQPAVDYLVQLASNYGTYKDPGVRLNSFLRLNSGPSFGVSPYMADIDSIPLSFSFLDGRNLALNPIVLVAQPWGGSAELVAQIRAAASVGVSSVLAGYGPAENDIRRLLVPASPYELHYQRYVRYLVRDNQTQKRQTDSSLEYVPVGDAIAGVIQCGFLQSNISGTIEAVILKIASFSPPGSMAGLFSDIVVNCRNLSALTEVEALLVDLSDNGGGYVSLAQLAAWAVSPRYRQDLLTTQFEFDVRIPGAPLGPDFILPQVNQSRPCQNASFAPFDDPNMFVQLSRSGRVSSYSPIYSSGELSWEMLPAIADGLDSLGYIPRVVLITDGTCGSACSMFETSIVNDNAGTIVSFGGILGQPMDTSSFGGGTVLEWSDYISALTPQLRAQLPASDFITTASARFTASEFYGPFQGLPREWIRNPAPYSLPFWMTSVDVEDMLQLYEYIIDNIVPNVPVIPVGPENFCTLPVRHETL